MTETNSNISYVAAVSVLFAIFAYTFRLLRLYKKVVNCWFCNTNVKVDSKETNSFVCPSCEQYNGFKEDGDYNCVIPAQLCEAYNPPPKQSPGNLGKSQPGFENGFCEMCNLYQALKIRALAEFSSETYKHNELEKFREKLENLYGLCQQCEATLHQTLGKQNSWLKPKLISWRLQQSKKLFFKATGSKTKWKNLTHLVCWKFLFLISVLMFLTHLGEYVQFFSPDMLKNFGSDFEMLLEQARTFNYILLYGGLSVNVLFAVTQEKIEIKDLFGFTGWFMLFASITLKTSFTEPNFFHFKIFSAFLNIVLIFLFNKKKSYSRGASNKAYIKVSKFNSIPKEESKLDESFISNCTLQKNNLKSSNESVYGSSQQIGSNYSSCSGGYSNTNSMSKSNDLDLGANLLGLKISTSKKCEPFSPQCLFLDNSKLRKASNYILQPSKLDKKIVTQSSWVAGGYWGSPGSPQRGRLTHQNVSSLDENRVKAPVFSLSRSSSQSSGFVSQFSDCTSSKTHIPVNSINARQTPLFGEADRASLLSEPSFRSWSSSPNSLQRPTMDACDAQSACSASSYLSSASLLQQYRPSSKANSFICDNYLPNLNDSLIHSDKLYDNTITTSKNYLPSYFNMGIAFVLGLSVSANIFLLIILYQFDLFSLKS